MRAAFAGADVFLSSVREQQQSHFVVVADGAEGEDGGNFGGQLAFVWLTEPKAPEPLASTSSITVISRSSMYS